MSVALCPSCQQFAVAKRGRFGPHLRSGWPVTPCPMAGRRTDAPPPREPVVVAR